MTKVECRPTEVGSSGDKNMIAQLRLLARALPLALVTLVSLATPSAAQKITQIMLTEKQIVGLLAAQKDFAPLANKLAEAADQPSPDLTKQLDATAQKHGFANFEEYRNVDNNIFLVFEGLDRETGAYVPPEERLNLELEEIKNDKTIPDDDKKAIITEVKEELSMAEAVQHPENIALVKKHLDKLSKLLPIPEDPELNRGSGMGEDGAQ